MWRKLSYLVLALATSLLWVDVYTHYGYLTSLLGISPKYIVLGILLITLQLIFTTPTARAHRSTWPLYLVVSILLFYSVLLAVEGANFQGYVFAHLGLRPESMFLPTLATIVVLLSLLRSSFWRFLVLTVLSFYFVRLTPIVITQSLVTLREIMRHPFASYEDKMHLSWGDFYQDMQATIATTSSDAKITIPRDIDRYPLHGNAALVRYFVYPRDVIVGELP